MRVRWNGVRVVITGRTPETVLVATRHERSATLELLHVAVEARGRGVGSALLVTFARLCRDAGVRRIDADDVSDRARTRRNIYAKHGFVYRRDSGPEMYANPRTVLETKELDSFVRI